MTLRQLLQALAATGAVAGAAGLAFHVMQPAPLLGELGSSLDAGSPAANLHDAGGFDAGGHDGGAFDAGPPGPAWLSVSLATGFTLSGDVLFQVGPDGRVLQRVTTRRGLLRALGPIDTPQKALAALAVEGLSAASFLADTAQIREASGGFEVKLVETQGDCPMIRVEQLYAVDAAGRVQYVKELGRSNSGWCSGRLPTGAVSVEAPPRGPGGYFAHLARLEALSVVAFDELHRQLAGWAAPPALLRRTQRAARDETRHALLANGLARRFGRRPLAVRPPPSSLHTRFEVARHNAEHGCTRETFGALVGLVQARSATDVGVREVMGSISRDEVRHAQLAWDVARWLESSLSPAERTEVCATRARTRRALCSGDAGLDPQTAALVGLPLGEAHRALARSLERSLS